MEKSAFQRYLEQRAEERQMEGDVAKVAKAMNDYNNSDKTPESRSKLFSSLEENELGSRDASTWWFRRASALVRAIRTYEASKGELKDVMDLNRELETICSHQSLQMELIKGSNVDDPFYEVHMRSYATLMLEDLQKELTVKGVDTGLVRKSTVSGFHEEAMGGGFRRGEFILQVSPGIRGQVMSRQIENLRNAGPVLRVIDEKHYPSDHDGNVAFMPGTPGKTLQGKAMIGDKLTDAPGGNSSSQYEVRRLLEDDYEPPQVESCDDVPIDQNPNYRQLNGPGKPKNHIRRGSVSNLFENLFMRATSVSKK